MSRVDKFKSFISESRRVLRVTKKPTKEEYLTISKVSGIGILIIGLIGFVLHLINELTALAVVAIVVIVLVLGLMFIGKKQ